MGRLHRVLLITPDLARQRAFYETQLGLPLAGEMPNGATFATRGATLALESGTSAELLLAFAVKNLDNRLEALRTRATPIEGEVHDEPWGRFAELRDPEGNRVRLVEPRQDPAAGRWPRLARAIVNAKKFAATVHFYRDALGLKPADDHEHWFEFDTGESRLAIHDREDTDSLALHEEQKVAFALEDDDLDAWAVELRGRGVAFAAAPSEADRGMQAEIEDGDGWFVVLNGLPPTPAIEDELAAEFEDDDEPRNTQIRRTGEPPPGEAAPRRAMTPAKLARKRAEKTGPKSFESIQREPERFSPPQRGDGPPRSGGYAGSRPSSGPRPGGFSPRPGGPGGSSRPSGPPRPGGSSRPSGPPRPGGSSSSGSRPSSSSGSSGAPRPSFGPSGPPRPPRPSGPPRPPRPDRGGRE